MKQTIILTFLVLIVCATCKFSGKLFTVDVEKVKGGASVEDVESRIEKEVWDRLEPNLALAGYSSTYPKEIIIVAFKEEQVLQIFSKRNNEIKLIKEYPFTASSGILGPKL